MLLSIRAMVTHTQSLSLIDFEKRDALVSQAVNLVAEILHEQGQLTAVDDFSFQSVEPTQVKYYSTFMTGEVQE